MATGTGLPTIANQAPVLAQAAGGVSGDALFNAQSWEKVAAAGEHLARAGGDYLKVAEHKAQVGYLSDQDVAIQRKQIELRNEHANDPPAFDAAWTGYTEGLQGSVEPWAVNHVRATAGQYGNSAYSAILNETRVQAEKTAETSWGALHDMAANDVQASAMAGTLNTPEGQLKIQKYKNVVATGVSSEFIPQAVADQRVATLESTATVYAARTGIQNTFNADGAIAATKQIDDIVRNEKLTLSPDQRLSLGARLRADVHAWDAERQQNLSTVDLESASLLKARQGGIPIPQSRIDDVIDRYKRFGGQAQASSFLADMQHTEDLSFLARVPTSEAAAWVDRYKTARGFNSPPQATKTARDYFQSQGWSKEQAAGIVGNLIHESGLNPGAVHDNGTGLGIAGWREDRLDALRAFAKAKGSAPTDFQTQLEFVNQELNGSESPAGIRLRNAKTPEQAAAAFIHFERPQGYDPANITAAHGYGNRVAQAIRASGGVVPTTPGDTTFIGRANTVVTKRVSDEADAIVAGMGDKTNPVLPTEQRINDLVTAASATNTPEVLEKVSRAAAEYQFRRQFGRAPEPTENAVVSELQRKAATDGLSATDARRLEIATETRDRTAKALADDPLNHTIGALAETSKLPTPAPLDVANPVQFQAGMQARAAWAATGTKTFETSAMPALTNAETAQVRAALDASDPAGKARIYRDIVQATSGATRAATLAAVGGKGANGTTGMVEAFAGGMAATDPAIGESIIRGQSAMKLKDAYNPMGEGNKSDSSAAIDKYLPAGAFTLAARTDPHGAFATMRGAVVARVADIAATDPNFAGKFTDAMFQRAVNDVTGGIVTHNGSSVIAPIRGMTQRGFDARMYGLTDGDVQGVMTQSGAPITADYIRNNAQLESLSDGRYLVRLGRDPERPIYAFRDTGTSQPGRLKPFVLDLRNIAPSSTLPYETAADPTGMANSYTR